LREDVMIKMMRKRRETGGRVGEGVISLLSGGEGEGGRGGKKWTQWDAEWGLLNVA